MATAVRATRAKAETTPDAIALLKNDHRAVDELFSEFESETNGTRKRAIAKRICEALKIHTTVEEELFYPACREAGVEKDLMDEAEVEHQSATRLIEEIDGGGVSEPLWEAKVTVLAEQVRHHVREEEKRGGVFTRARAADIDLDALGEQMAERMTALRKGK